MSMLIDQLLIVCRFNKYGFLLKNHKKMYFLERLVKLRWYVFERVFKNIFIHMTAWRIWTYAYIWDKAIKLKADSASYPPTPTLSLSFEDFLFFGVFFWYTSRLYKDLKKRLDSEGNKFFTNKSLISTMLKIFEVRKYLWKFRYWDYLHYTM